MTKKNKDNITRALRGIILSAIFIIPLYMLIYVALFPGIVLPITKFYYLLPPKPGVELAGVLDFAGTKLNSVVALVITVATLILTLKKKEINWKLLGKILVSIVLFGIISFSFIYLLLTMQTVFIEPMADLSRGVRPYILLLIYLIPDVIAISIVKYLFFRNNNKKKTRKKNKK